MLHDTSTNEILYHDFNVVYARDKIKRKIKFHSARNTLLGWKNILIYSRLISERHQNTMLIKKIILRSMHLIML